MKDFLFQDSNGNSARIRACPWDSRILHTPSVELADFVCVEPRTMQNLLQSIEFQFEKDGVGFAWARVKSQERQLRALLQAARFEYVETALRFETLNLKSFITDPGIRNVKVRVATPSDAKELRRIASTAFDYGRFHEDPKIPRAIANERFSNWIDDLLSKETTILVMDGQNGLVSFMAYSTDIPGIQAELLLGGSQRNCGLASVWFWSSVLSHLRNSGVTRVATTVSAANARVINLYAALGFRVRETNVTFHRHLRTTNDQLECWGALGK